MSDRKVQWTEAGKQQINELRKLIIKKKIMLGIMIDDYSLLDRRFRYVHTGLASLIPLISFVDETVSGNTDRTTITTIILSGVVAGMIKISNTLKFGKMVTIAQQQTVKYKQLYQRVEREMNKPDSKRETEESFIYWVNREYNNVEMADPDLTDNMKKKFIAICKEKGIPYDEDLDALTSLIAETTHELVQVVVEKVTDDVAPDAKKEENKPNAEDNTTQPTSPTSPVQPTQPTQHRRQSTMRPRTTSDEIDRTQYKETMQKFNSTEDMRWALDRLTDIQQ